MFRPRLIDIHNIQKSQEDLDFAIPIVDEDIPLYVDPFLLWKSVSQQDQSLHTSIVNAFNQLGNEYLKGDEKEAISKLITLSECESIGLGLSKTRRGKRISEKQAISILQLFKNIPQINKQGFLHFEEIQLLVDNISKDRISDLACNFILSFLIDFTIEQCENLGIPIEEVQLDHVYNYRDNKISQETTFLPVNPKNSDPIVFVPKRWLRFVPWINYEDYFKGYFIEKGLNGEDELPDRVKLLNYNRHNYDIFSTYIKQKEKKQADCLNDPLFKQIPILSSKRKISELEKTPSGLEDKADKKFEDIICTLLPSFFYPHLDFALDQSRTDSGVLIRDLIFYNNRNFEFLDDIYKDYESKQIVFELKNTKSIDRNHINQLNRYLSDSLGKFGVIVTRNRPPKKIIKNTIDLWAGQRRCILILSDEDIKLMSIVFESKQRLPIEILKSKYVEFMRQCPS
ncbi:hypothetical protein [Aequorivita sinensis]|uniref:hypothetical protein n=1 Tax=Aequorivita sinensis TaxID=1382458 RepID=UPI001123372E|nr:hypothetical protein [Aequorivita sinensis]